MVVIQSGKKRQEDLRREKRTERGVDSFSYLTQPNGAVGPNIRGGEWERLAVEWPCGAMGCAAAFLRHPAQVGKLSQASLVYQRHAAPFLLCT